MKSNEILKIYGKDYTDMTVKLLEKADLEEAIVNRKNDKNLRIAIKPNLVSCTPAMFGATTHPEVVEGIIIYLKDRGYNNICIIEGSWVGDKTEEAFEYCGYNKLSEKYNVELIDTQKDSAVKVNDTGMELNICKSVFDSDFLINVPVLKGHCMTIITCALKNMKGLIPNSEKRRFHTLGLHEPVAHLNVDIKQDFIVVDHICGDPYSECGGENWDTDCVMAAIDPVLLDTYVANIFKSTPKDIPYIELSAKMGVGCSDLSTLKVLRIEDDKVSEEDLDAECLPKNHDLMSIKSLITDCDACSACYAECLEALNRLEEEGKEFKGKICLGQAYRGKKGKYGVGNCTRLFEHSVKGCPPGTDDIYNELIRWIDEQ